MFGVCDKQVAPDILIGQQRLVMLYCKFTLVLHLYHEWPIGISAATFLLLMGLLKLESPLTGRCSGISLRRYGHSEFC